MFENVSDVNLADLNEIVERAIKSFPSRCIAGASELEVFYAATTSSVNLVGTDAIPIGIAGDRTSS